MSRRYFFRLRKKIKRMSMKERVAEEIAKRVKNGDVLGVGTGSTVDLALIRIGERVKAEKLTVHVVPTSYESAWDCEQRGLHVLSPGYLQELSWGFDGADEVDPELSLVKGRGGAMLKEKILAAKCKKFVVIVDDSKLVKKLGEKFPIPVEVIPEARGLVERKLKSLGAKTIELREGGKKHGPVITEAGNIILDCTFGSLSKNSERDIKSIVGVVESGLFIGYASEVLIGSEAGVRSLFPST